MNDHYKKYKILKGVGEDTLISALSVKCQFKADLEWLVVSHSVHKLTDVDRYTNLKKQNDLSGIL